MLLEISGEITPERTKGWSQSKKNTPQGACELFGKTGGFQIETLTCVWLASPPTCCVTLASPNPFLGLLLPIPEKQRSSWVSESEPEKGGWTASDLCITSHSRTQYNSWHTVGLRTCICG